MTGFISVMSAKGIVMSARSDQSVMLRAAALLGAVMALLYMPMPAGAHAALITAETAPAIRLHAHYDTGEPMAQAQVLIYAPDRPSEVWGRGLTDAQGRFEFLPDAAAGRWSIQVRQAGHGAMAHVFLDDTGPTVLSAGAGAQSWLQRLVMVVLVAWGALGTALYLRLRRGGRDASA